MKTKIIKLSNCRTYDATNNRYRAETIWLNVNEIQAMTEIIENDIVIGTYIFRTNMSTLIDDRTPDELMDIINHL